MTFTVTLVDDRIICTLQLYVDEKQLIPMRAAVSNAVRTTVGDQVGHDAVFKTVEDASVWIVTQLEVLPMISVGRTKSDECISPIATFVVRTVKQNAEKVQ